MRYPCKADHYYAKRHSIGQMHQRRENISCSLHTSVWFFITLSACYLDRIFLYKAEGRVN